MSVFRLARGSALFRSEVSPASCESLAFSALTPAFAQLRCEKQLVIVPGATHLFEESGGLENVARLARQWFERHLIGV